MSGGNTFDLGANDDFGKGTDKMAKPEEVGGYADARMKGSKKSDRERFLEKRIDTLKEQLNSQLDKVKGLKQTFQTQMEKMRTVNDKLQEDNMELIQKHDNRLIKYMELSDQADVMERALAKLGYDTRGEALPEEDSSPDEEGGEAGAAEVLEEGED